MIVTIITDTQPVGVASPSNMETVAVDIVVDEFDEQVVDDDGFVLFTLDDDGDDEMSLPVVENTVTIVTTYAPPAFLAEVDTDMAINKRYDSYVWHVGETATAFTVQLKNRDGTARTDIASATFTLVDNSPESATYGDRLIDEEACQSVENGLLSYLPTALEMATACKFLAQFTATLAVSGLVLPTVHIEGEIEANL